MSFVKKVVTALKGKKKSETYATKLPQFESETEMSRFINRKLEAEHAETKAQLLKAQAKLEEKDQQKQQKVLESEVAKSILAQRRVKKESDRGRALSLQFVGIRPPTFFLKSNRGFKRLKGIYLQETEEGGLLWYPWLTDGKAVGGKNERFVVPSGSFEEMFKERIGIVSQIRAGKVDSNFDVTRKGVPVLKSPVYVNENMEVTKVVDLSATQRKEYEDRIEELNDQVSQVYHQLKQYKLKNSEQVGRIAEMEIDNSVASSERNTFAAISAHYGEKQKTSTKSLADSESVIQDLKIQQILESRMKESLQVALDKMHKLLRERMSMGETEITASQMRAIANQAAQEAIRSIPTAGGAYAISRPAEQGSPKRTKGGSEEA